jgi:hypothetical protein
MFSTLGGPALSNGMHATANIKPQSVLVYQAKNLQKKLGSGQQARNMYFPLLAFTSLKGTRTHR